MLGGDNVIGCNKIVISLGFLLLIKKKSVSPRAISSSIGFFSQN